MACYLIFPPLSRRAYTEKFYVKHCQNVNFVIEIFSLYAVCKCAWPFPMVDMSKKGKIFYFSSYSFSKIFLATILDDYLSNNVYAGSIDWLA